MSNLIRFQVVAAAEREIGSTNPTPYWVDVLPDVPRHSWPKHWCGAFALWALHQAGLAKGWTWIIGPPYGFLYRLGWGEIVDRPKPGDIAYFKKHQHHAVVADVFGSKVTTIDGNAGVFGGKVVKKKRKLSTVTSFHSIESLLPQEKPEHYKPPNNNRRNLKYGMKGQDVRVWQKFLGEQLLTDKFDTTTLEATRRYQLSHALVPDGIVGPRTRAKAGL